MPDFGTARCDFPGGSSEMLYQSIQKILALPNETRIFVGHDYKAPGRDEYAWETTVGEQKAKNIHIGAGKSEEEFTTMRDERDATLAMPKLIIPSLQVNMRAGNMPEPDDNGDVYLKGARKQTLTSNWHRQQKHLCLCLNPLLDMIYIVFRI